MNNLLANDTKPPGWDAVETALFGRG